MLLNNENENEINSLLFDETPEAWIHGPVFKTLYNEYRTFNWHEKTKNEELHPHTHSHRHPGILRQVLSQLRTFRPGDTCPCERYFDQGGGK